MAEPRYLVAGSVSFDRLVVGGRRLRRLGGTTVYAGLTAARLGADVAIVARVPENRHGELARREGGPDWRVGPSRQATVFANEETGPGRRTQRVESTADPLSAADLADAGTFDAVHLGPLHPGDLDRRAADAARRAPVVLLDIQGLCRRIAGGRVEGAAAPDLVHWLERADWIKADPHEWALASEHLAAPPAAALRRFGWSGLLVTRGPSGGSLHLPAGRVDWEAADPGPAVGEGFAETGAGDVFAAAFLVYVLRGRIPEEAVVEAARIAADQAGGRWLGAAELDAGDPGRFPPSPRNP